MTPYQACILLPPAKQNLNLFEYPLLPQAAQVTEGEAKHIPSSRVRLEFLK